jgi:hypothetical protein
MCKCDVFLPVVWPMVLDYLFEETMVISRSSDLGFLRPWVSEQGD